jgi:hypothetical protein
MLLIRAMLYAVDIETGEFGGPVTNATCLPMDQLLAAKNPQDLVLLTAQRAAEELVCHELYEWLRYDGEFIRDPHPEERK